MLLRSHCNGLGWGSLYSHYNSLASRPYVAILMFKDNSPCIAIIMLYDLGPCVAITVV
jgi:hypothetical protein